MVNQLNTNKDKRVEHLPQALIVRAYSLICHVPELYPDTSYSVKRTALLIKTGDITSLHYLTDAHFERDEGHYQH